MLLNVKPRVRKFYAVTDDNLVSLKCLVYALVSYNILVLTSFFRPVAVWLKVKYFCEVRRGSLLEFRYGDEITGKNIAIASHKFPQ